MAKAKPGAKKTPVKPVAGNGQKSKLSVVKALGKLVRDIASPGKAKASSKPETKPKSVEPKATEAKSIEAKSIEAKSTEAKPKVGKGKAAAVKETKPKAEAKSKAKPAEAVAASVPVVMKRPRATRLPPVGEALTPREMEQVLTVSQGRGVTGEGSLKGRLVLKEGLPTLLVVGRDKRELSFVLQGPDQEVLPAYVDHKVSVTGLIRKVGSQGGTVDVRKYSAKKPEQEVVPETPVDQKLRYLSPGEVEQIANPGMGAGMRGFGTMRGSLELSGEDFFLVVSNGGTRQQVSFVLEGKVQKSLRKSLGQIVQVTGVVEKSSGWGGRIQVEVVEPRPNEYRAVSRDSLEITHVEASGTSGSSEVELNQGLTVRLPERQGHTWAIEPMMAKRISLREANFEVSSGGTHTREFFFTPRNPGTFEVEFFLAKAFTPAQVTKTFKLNLAVKTP
jgi:hypothetical protein